MSFVFVVKYKLSQCICEEGDICIPEANYGVTFKAVSSEVAVRKCLCFSLLRCSPVAQSGVHPSGPSPCSWWQFCGRGGTSRATLSCSGSPAIASFKTENEYSFFRIFTF